MVKSKRAVWPVFRRQPSGTDETGYRKEMQKKMKGGFGKFIHQTRLSQRKSVYDMEKKGGITHRTVENIENGLYNPRNITFATIVLMSNYLNFPLETAVKMLMEELYESGWDNGEYLEGRCKKS